MPKIAFWSPITNQTGQTAIAVAVSSLMGLEYNYSSILTHTHWKSIKLETSFFNLLDMKKIGVFENTNVGINALDRLISSRKLTPENVKNYAKPILKGRLDLLFGSNASDKELYYKIFENMKYIFDESAKIYDLVYIDCNKSSQSDVVNNLLENSDLIVVTMNQDFVSVDEFLDGLDKIEILKRKPFIIVVGNYQKDSKYNVSNLKGNYGVKEPLYTCPYSLNYLDASNDGKVLDFFLKNKNAGNNDLNGFYMQEVRKICQAIIKKLNLKTK